MISAEQPVAPSASARIFKPLIASLATTSAVATPSVARTNPGKVTLALLADRLTLPAQVVSLKVTVTVNGSPTVTVSAEAVTEDMARAGGASGVNTVIALDSP